VNWQTEMLLWLRQTLALVGVLALILWQVGRLRNEQIILKLIRESKLTYLNEIRDTCASLRMSKDAVDSTLRRLFLKGDISIAGPNTVLAGRRRPRRSVVRYLARLVVRYRRKPVESASSFAEGT
jgi:hypothetical protein